MSSIPDFLSLATTVVVLGLIVAAVMKMFQISAHMEEMKEILKDIRRGTAGIAPVAPTQPIYAAPPEAYSSDAVSALAAAVPQPDAPPPHPPVQSPVPAPVPQEPLRVSPGMNFNRPPTAEELVRAIHEQDFRGDNFPL